MCCARGSGASAIATRDEPRAGNKVKIARSIRQRGLGNDRDDPACQVAGLNFHDRMDQPGDKASLNRQGCLLVAMLVIAAASRDFWIGRLERLHIDQAAVRESVPRRYARGSLLQSAAASARQEPCHGFAGSAYKVHSDTPGSSGSDETWTRLSGSEVLHRVRPTIRLYPVLCRFNAGFDTRAEHDGPFG